MNESSDKTYESLRRPTYREDEVLGGDEKPHVPNNQDARVDERERANIRKDARDEFDALRDAN